MSEHTKVTADQVQKLRDARDKYIQWLKLEAEEKVRALEQPVPTDLFAAGAEASLTFLVIIKGHLTADLIFDSGPKMHFDAWPWGVGAFGGKGFGLYFGVNQATLVGRCTYWCQGLTFQAGGLQITFFRAPFGPIGQIDVAVAGVGAGEIGGDDGQWTFA